MRVSRTRRPAWSSPDTILPGFLHGGPPLSALDAPSSVPLGSGLGATTAQSSKPIATARWRAFTDEEQITLEKGWALLLEEREKQKASGETEGAEKPAEDSDVEDPGQS